MICLLGLRMFIKKQKKKLPIKKYGRFTLLYETYKEYPIQKKKYTAWVCRCDCGKEKIVRETSLRNGYIVSCGCYQKERIAREGALQRAHNPRKNNFILTAYNTHKTCSKQRGIPTSLSFADFERLVTSPCFYCGVAGSKLIYRKAKKKDVVGRVINGIDRKVNSEGYTLTNGIPCCGRCNVAKHTLDFEEFIDWIFHISDFLKQKKFLQTKNLPSWGFSVEEIQDLLGKTKEENKDILKNKKASLVSSTLGREKVVKNGKKLK